jgi:hypothetical protein
MGSTVVRHAIHFAHLHADTQGLIGIREVRLNEQRRGIPEVATSTVGALWSVICPKNSLEQMAYASIAQLVERDFSRVKVQSSTLCGSTCVYGTHSFGGISPMSPPYTFSHALDHMQRMYKL